MAGTNSGAATLSHLVRMRPLSLHELPPLSTTADQAPRQDGSTAPSLESFVTQALDDAHAFMTSYVPAKFDVKKKSQDSAPSTAKVEVSAHVVKAQDLPKEVRDKGAPDENWFSRVSIHENAAKQGSADWEEFDAGLRANHSQHEMDYTPGVVDAHEMMNWEKELAGLGGKVGGWEKVEVRVMEMQHQIPPPLNNRIFTVVVVAASRGSEFLVVQIPVQQEGLPNPRKHESSSVTAGQYVSVEWCEVVDEGANVKWAMAMSSDAGGNLPMFVQKLGVTGAVVKDVGFFIDWCAKNRKS